MTKREWIFKAFNGEEVDRVPMGFWFHFVKGNVSWADYRTNPQWVEDNVAGHTRFIREFAPDFVKLMTDGYFRYPLAGGVTSIKTIADLDAIKPIKEDDPWIQNQVAYAKRIKAACDDMVYWYNSFGPATMLKILIVEEDISKYKFETVTNLLLENPERCAQAMDILADGMSLAVKNVLEQAGMDGIYFSVSNPDISRISDDFYTRYVAPYEKRILDTANRYSDNNALHICGLYGARNNLKLYTGYQAKVYNWSCAAEGVTLAEGRTLFGGKTILGGFPNGPDDVLCAGTKEEIQAFTEKIVKEFGKKGLIIGADCALPTDVPREHLRWVREKLQMM